MEECFDHILLFKTNISNDAKKQFLYTLLDNHPAVEQWNIDLNDEDYVLRIISYHLTHQQIIDLITDHGYYCCVLT
jgi:hypothetical protein